MARHVKYVRDVERIALRALDKGGVLVSPSVVRWDCAGGCEKPHEFTIEGRTPAGGFMGTVPAPIGRVLFIDMAVPCRTCEHCLARRSYQWRCRAEREIALSARTWFGTFTLRPETHVIHEYRASLRLRQAGVDFYALDWRRQFAERHSECSRDFTKYFKRLRKAGQVFRYLLVLEAHQSGLPHYHALLHEPHGTPGCRKSVLEKHWWLGFSSFRLAEQGSAPYVCKYLVKSALARQRASLHYGGSGL